MDWELLDWGLAIVILFGALGLTMLACMGVMTMMPKGDRDDTEN